MKLPDSSAMMFDGGDIGFDCTFTAVGDCCLILRPFSSYIDLGFSGFCWQPFRLTAFFARSLFWLLFVVSPFLGAFLFVAEFWFVLFLPKFRVFKSALEVCLLCEDF